MSIDFSKPVNTDLASGVLAQLRENVSSILTQTMGSGTNVPTGSFRLNPTSGVPEYWNGSAWSKIGFSTAASTGSANSQSITVGAGITAYQDGQWFRFPIGFSNTASCTLNVNGIGAVTIYDARVVGQPALRSSELLVGGIAEVVYYNSKFYLLNAAPGFTSWTPTITASGTMGVSATSDISCYYSITGKLMTLWMNKNLTLTAPAATGLYFTMPGSYTISSIQPQYTSIGSGVYYNASTDVTIMSRTQSTTLILLQKYDGSNYTVGAFNQQIRAECRVILA